MPCTLDHGETGALRHRRERVTDGIESEASVVLPVEVERGNGGGQAEGVLGVGERWIVERRIEHRSVVPQRRSESLRIADRRTDVVDVLAGRIAR